MIHHSAAWYVRDAELATEIIAEHRRNAMQPPYDTTRCKELLHELAAHRSIDPPHLPDRWAVTKIVATLCRQYGGHRSIREGQTE